MKLLPLLMLVIMLQFSACQPENDTQTRADFVLVIHGGAGTIVREHMTPSLEKQYRFKLNQALEAGAKILADSGSSLDAITRVICMLEDSPLFNAGRGAVFTEEGINEMDASIMEGAYLNAGAVSGLKTIKNPILAARAVMEKSEHVMLSGAGADAFAMRQNLRVVDPSYFYTDERWDSYLKAKEKSASADTEKHGTVGAVALDMNGNLAAGTSTGGMTLKKKGRVGDAPIIGAGTYADNTSCAVSATGHGEYFIRNVVAHEIASLVKYKGLSLEEAARQVILVKLKDMGGDGGVIAVDSKGNFTMTFNTRGMYRAYITSDGKTGVMIYDDEQE